MPCDVNSPEINVLQLVTKSVSYIYEYIKYY